MSDGQTDLRVALDRNPAPSLGAILASVGEDRVERWAWVVGDLDYSGTSETFRAFADEIASATHRQVLTPGRQVLKLSREPGQVIDGSFAGFETAEEARGYLRDSASAAPAILVRFRDSTWVDLRVGPRDAKRLTQDLELADLTTAAEGPAPDLGRRASELRLFDVVQLAVDRTDLGLRKGTRGAIVEIFSDPEGYEVDFVDRDGTPLATASVLRDEIVEDSG